MNTVKIERMRERLTQTFKEIQAEDLSENESFLAFLEEVKEVVVTYEPTNEELYAAGLWIEIAGEGVL